MITIMHVPHALVVLRHYSDLDKHVAETTVQRTILKMTRQSLDSYVVRSKYSK